MPDSSNHKSTISQFFVVDSSPVGSPTVRDLRLGESMHSRLGALEEAQAIYIQQSKLDERLAQTVQEPLVLWGRRYGNRN
jgi:hypothetical protein